MDSFNFFWVNDLVGQPIVVDMYEYTGLRCTCTESDFTHCICMEKLRHCISWRCTSVTMRSLDLVLANERGGYFCPNKQSNPLELMSKHVSSVRIECFGTNQAKRDADRWSPECLYGRLIGEIHHRCKNAFNIANTAAWSVPLTQCLDRNGPIGIMPAWWQCSGNTEMSAGTDSISVWEFQSVCSKGGAEHSVQCACVCSWSIFSINSDAYDCVTRLAWLVVSVWLSHREKMLVAVIRADRCVVGDYDRGKG